MRHRFHALCPYFAMFPEEFAETWISRLSKAGDIVLDPFSGRGTTAFQAMLMGRKPIASDVNDVAYCITRAKTNAPLLSSVRRRLTTLEGDYHHSAWRRRANEMPEFFQFAFHPTTRSQLLYLRQALNWNRSDTDCMIAGLILGALHGESERSPSYLSNQMPRTISTKPAYSVRYWKKHGFVAPERDVFELIRRQAAFRYESEPPRGDSWILHRDMRHLAWLTDELPTPVKLIVTSPPYLDVTNFEEDQWLRLWFLGGPTHPTIGRVSRDDRHCRGDDYWGFIADMWRMLGTVASKKANVVIRIGARGIEPNEIGTRLVACSRFSQRPIDLVEQTLSDLKRRQTDSFSPGTKGCLVEVDCHFQFKS